MRPGSPDAGRRARGVHNLAVWARGLAAIGELNRRGIPTIVLKSLPQIEEIYGDISGRLSTDVDLVVPSSHVSDALDALEELGWRVYEQRLLDLLCSVSGRERAVRSRPWHLVGSGRASGMVIDLHSDAMEPYWKPVLDRRVWERALPVAQDGVDFLILSAEDRLLFLCWHFFGDSYETLAWDKLVDIERILMGVASLDWEYMTRRARSTGVTLVLRLACDLAASRSTALDVPHRWKRVPVVPRLRYALFGAAVIRDADQLGGHQIRLVKLLLHDRLRVVLPLWQETFFPSKVSVAVSRPGGLPSWPRYFLALGAIYRQRLRRIG